MPKIVAVPVAEAKSEKFVLPEPTLTFEVDAESGNIRVIALFENVDPDVAKASKKTMYLAKTNNPADVEFQLDGQSQVLTVAGQPLQVKMSLSYPMPAEEKKEIPAGNGEGSESDDDDDETV